MTIPTGILKARPADSTPLMRPMLTWVSKKQALSAAIFPPTGTGAWALAIGAPSGRMAQPAAAVSAFEAATTHAPQDAEALAGLIDARIATRDLTGAASALATFRKLAPGSLQSLLLSGALAYAREDWAEAAAALGKFVQQAPRHPQALLMLAGSYFRLNQLNQAETVLQKLAPLQAAGQTAGQRLQAVILLKQHRAAEAVQVLRPLVAEDAPDPGLLALARLLADRSDVLDTWPADVLHRLLGRVLDDNALCDEEVRELTELLVEITGEPVSVIFY